jgi:hypothetical protein
MGMLAVGWEWEVCQDPMKYERKKGKKQSVF